MQAYELNANGWEISVEEGILSFPGGGGESYTYYLDPVTTLSKELS